MKQVIIVRHAKAVHYGYDSDFERGLAERGFSDAEMVANEVSALSIRPDKIISSSAKRALTTATLFAKILQFDVNKIEATKSLYFDYTTQEFIEMIQKANDSVNNVFIFGHNPFVQFMSSNLTTNFDGHMPTSSTVIIQFEINSWSELTARTGKVLHHLYPSKIR